MGSKSRYCLVGQQCHIMDMGGMGNGGGNPRQSGEEVGGDPLQSGEEGGEHLYRLVKREVSSSSEW